MLSIAEHASTSLEEARTALAGARKVAVRAEASALYVKRFQRAEDAIDARDPAVPKKQPEPAAAGARHNGAAFSFDGISFNIGPVFTSTSASFRSFEDAIRYAQNLWDGPSPGQQYRVDPEKAAEEVARHDEAAKAARTTADALVDEANRLAEIANRHIEKWKVVRRDAQLARDRAQEAERIAREMRRRYGL